MLRSIVHWVPERSSHFRDCLSFSASYIALDNRVLSERRRSACDESVLYVLREHRVNWADQAF
jgi:hypothetical protein